MKTLDDLTPEIRAKIPQYIERATKDLYNGVEWDNFDIKKVEEYIEFVYKLAGYNKPRVVVANDPTIYKVYYNNLQEIIDNPDHNLDFDMEDSENLKAAESHYLFACSVYSRGYFTWYKFLKDEFKLECGVAKELDYLYENANNGIGRCFFTEELVLVLRAPQFVRRNDLGFHSTTQAAIEYPNYKMYYINGRRVRNDIFEAVLNKTFTFDDFVKLDNEEDKAAVVTMIKENEGGRGLLKFLQAELIDEQTITHDSGCEEIVRLYKTKQTYEFLQDHEGNFNQPYTWVEMKCPSTGQIYLEDTNPALNTAIDAMKYHRPTDVPFDTIYNFKLFNN